MDPVSMALAAAGLVSNLMSSTAARKTASANQAQQEQALNFQQQNLASALAAARSASNARLAQAGAAKTDQYGNTTYYDPTQGRWVTTFSPTQQRLIAADQARQERTLARGAQAGEDYQQARAGYLYKQPETEDQIRAELVNLITQARGEGDRALQTLVKRQELRQTGNMPVVYSSQGLPPGPGERLAQTMLQARQQALQERQSRVKAHQEEYLPELAAFQNTANAQAPEGTTGRGIVGMANQGNTDMLAALGEYEKELPGIYKTASTGYGSAFGAQNTAADIASRAATTGPNLSQYAQLISALKPSGAQTKGGAVLPKGGFGGDTTGATYSAPTSYSAMDPVFQSTQSVPTDMWYF